MTRRDIEEKLAKHYGLKNHIIHTNITCLNIREAGKSDMLVIDRKKRCEELKIFMEIDTLRNEYAKNFLIWDERIYRTVYVFPKSLYINCTKNIDIIIPKNFGLILVDDSGIGDIKLIKHRLGEYNSNSRNLTDKEIFNICMDGNDVRWKYQSLVGRDNELKKVGIGYW